MEADTFPKSCSRDWNREDAALSILFRCLSVDANSSDQLLHTINSLVKDATIEGAQSTFDGDESTLLVTRGNSLCRLFAEILAEPIHVRTGVNTLRLTTSVAISTAEADEPEAAGLCWEVLVAVSLFAPCPVWINDSCYSTNYLERADAEPEPCVIRSVAGSVLTEVGFNKFYEAP
jgi:hypothetical protein